MKFILWLDMPDDGTLDATDALIEAVASIHRNEELQWDLLNDDDTIFAENVSLPTPQERRFRELRQRIESAAAEESRTDRAIRGGNILHDLKKYEDTYGSDTASRELKAQLLTTCMGLPEDRARKSAGLPRIEPAAAEAPKDELPWCVSDSKDVPVGGSIPVLGRFATQDLAAHFIGTLDEYKSGRYNLDGPSDDEPVDVRDHTLASYDPVVALTECVDLYDSGAWPDVNDSDNLIEVIGHARRLAEKAGRERRQN